MSNLDKKTRIVFVNLHGNEFLVKTLDKMIFKRSVAIKHQYLLEYLLNREDIEVCSYINKVGGTLLSYSSTGWFANALRFLEHPYVMRKNGINPKKITVLKKESEIKDDDILVMYRYYADNSMTTWEHLPNCLRVVCMIHFTAEPDALKAADPDILYNESDLMKHSDMFREYNQWYQHESITIPFIPASRFKVVKPFAERQNKVFSTGTVTYMHNITKYYGNPCAQPARRQIIDNREALSDIIDCYNSDYLEDDEGKKIDPKDNVLVRLYKKMYNKTHNGRQKKYYSFDMVEKFNDYKLCLVGEEIMGIPGIGFVEGMACGCAYIGDSTKGYYEDYGMQEGVHYIGYNGTVQDLRAKVEYWLQPEHQAELEQIARQGNEFVKTNFIKEIVAKRLIDSLIEARDKKLKHEC
jgi:glycosyltransferase involved in cell wall biosynthesis